MMPAHPAGMAAPRPRYTELSTEFSDEARHVPDALAPAGTRLQRRPGVRPARAAHRGRAGLQRGLDRRALHLALGAEPLARRADRPGAAADEADQARARRSSPALPPPGRAGLPRRLHGSPGA